MTPRDNLRRRQEDRELRETFVRKKLLADFREVIALPAGRRVLWWILSLSSVFGNCFTGNSVTYFNEGKREVGLRILNMIDDADENAFHELRREEYRRMEDEAEFAESRKKTG